MVLLRKVARFGWIDYLCIGPRHAHATWRASDGNRPDSRTESLLYLRENLDRIRSDPGCRVNAVIIQEPPHWQGTTYADAQEYTTSAEAAKRRSDQRQVLLG